MNRGFQAFRLGPNGVYALISLLERVRSLIGAVDQRIGTLTSTECYSGKSNTNDGFHSSFHSMFMLLCLSRRNGGKIVWEL